MEENERQIPMSEHKKQEGNELKSFISCFKWVFVDQSNIWKTVLSWSIFIVLTIVIPVISHLLLSCSTCDKDHDRPYHIPVQIFLSLFATISFFNLSSWLRKFGLRKFLFFDKLYDASEKVRHGYKEQLQKTMTIFFIFVLLCFTTEALYKIWWYVTGASQLPYYGNRYISDTILCLLELCSWLYRTSIFFLVCVLFRLACHLQMLRVEDFAQVFRDHTEVDLILIEHLRIRRSFQIISHRFRGFVLLSLLLVTANQLTALLMTTKSTSSVNIFKAGELALCSISLVAGLFLCLRSATKVTHKAQSITGLAAKWNVCATINSFNHPSEAETPIVPQISSTQVFTLPEESDDDDEEVGGDDLDDAKLVPIYTHTISFHKRQALVTYLESNRAGITVFGFMMDRAWLHSIFGIEFALLLWLLNKTIGIS